MNSGPYGPAAVALAESEEAYLRRLIATHIDDGTEHCSVCPQRPPYPCAERWGGRAPAPAGRQEDLIGS